MSTTAVGRRYSAAQVETLVTDFHRDGLIVLKNHFPKSLLQKWHDAFIPLLQKHIAREGDLKNRGAGRYYVTLPFDAPFADPQIFEDEDILAIVEQLVGQHFVMCQLATDTPCEGSEYQQFHRDTPPLFPETGEETPSYQLAVNFPLVDVTAENGPLDFTRGTHKMSRDEAMKQIEAGTIKVESLLMDLGDVLIRDVRHVHRGTPNNCGVPRPMVVIGYSRKWLHRPEVNIQVPKKVHETLSQRAKQMLRFNPVVESVGELDTETYQSFAY